jgi:uncharacterized protein with PIN domain/tRNA(Ser,Leu) C12 N-acetylase TAN1
MTTYLLRFAEIGRELQDGRNKLRRDLETLVRERVPGAAIEHGPGRLVVTAEAEALATLAGLHGVASISPCERVAHEAVETAVLALAARVITADARFAVRVRRFGEKTGSLASERTPDIAKRLADAVSRATGATVDLTRPDVTLGVELRGDDAFVFDRAIAGIDRTGPRVPRAAGEPCFVADQMLGRLAARLRLLGYDTLTVYDLADSEVTRLAAADGRILLTRDGPLARTQAVPVHRVLATAPREQLAEVIAALALSPDPARYFTRCTLCNTPVDAVDEAEVAGELPEGVRGKGLTFARCPACAQLYWRGSHVERILADLGAAGVTT